MEEWMLLQGFYHGLNQKASEHLDANAGGSFCHSLRKQLTYSCTRSQRIKIGPRRTSNTVIKAKKYKKMKN
jgi:hypothetical protein